MQRAAEAAWCHLRDTQKLALNPSWAREAEDGDNGVCCLQGYTGSWVSTTPQVRSGSLEGSSLSRAKCLLLRPTVQHG